MQTRAWVIVVSIVFILMCVVLAIIVLLQQRGKGGMAGVFGGGGGGGTGAEQIFGSSGVAPFMTKLTAILGAVFVAFSLVLVLLVAPPVSAGRDSGEGSGVSQGVLIPGQNVGSTAQTEMVETEPEQGPGQAPAETSDVRQLLFDTTGSGGL